MPHVFLPPSPPSLYAFLVTVLSLNFIMFIIFLENQGEIEEKMKTDITPLARARVLHHLVGRITQLLLPTAKHVVTELSRNRTAGTGRREMGG